MRSEAEAVSPATRERVEPAQLRAAVVAAALGLAAPPATLALDSALPEAWAAHPAALAWGAVAFAVVVGAGLLVEGLRPCASRADLRRCRRCSYDVATTLAAQVRICPECGADLQRPGAVARRPSRDQRRIAMGAATLALGAGPTLAVHAHAPLERSAVALFAPVAGPPSVVEHPLAPRAFRWAPTPAAQAP